MRRKYVPLPPYERLQALLEYNPETGIFTRRESRRRWKSGEVVGTKSADGYININIDYQVYRAHRLAWLYMTGGEPASGIDHVNRNRADNRWSNLREASQPENTLNRSAQSNNKTGYKGVHKIKKTGRFRAVCTVRGNRVNVGCFDTAEEAKSAHDAVAKILHGDFFCG